MSWMQFLRDTAVFSTAYNTHQTSKKLDKINDSIKDFKNQMSEDIGRVRETLERGFSILSLELATQSKTFKNIETVLKNKRKNEAEELKNMGLKALKNGWYKDALDEFSKSIELNKYDYQVYYLSAKCFEQLKDYSQQELFLKKSLFYSSEDIEFRDYVILDIVGLLIKSKQNEEAINLFETLYSAENQSECSSPIHLSKLIIDIFSNTYDEQTLKHIDGAITKYKGEDHSRIISAIEILMDFVDRKFRDNIEKRLNRNKSEMIKDTGKLLNIKLKNLSLLIDSLESNEKNFKHSFKETQLMQNKYMLSLDSDESTEKWMNNKELSRAASLYSSRLTVWSNIPYVMKERLFPDFVSLANLKKTITQCIALTENSKLSDYQAIVYLDRLLDQLYMQSFISTKELLQTTGKRSVLSNILNPTNGNILPFNVGQNDNIIYQCRFEDESLLTLTYFSVILLDKNKKSYKYTINEYLTNLEFEELNNTVQVFKNILKDKPLSVTYSKLILISDKRDGNNLILAESNHFVNEGEIDKTKNIKTLMNSFDYFQLVTKVVFLYSGYLEFLNRSFEILKTSFSLFGNLQNVEQPTLSDEKVEFTLKKEVNDNEVEFLD